MKDETDSKTLELPAAPEVPKKRGRKPANPVLGAKSAASRKRDQRAKEWAHIMEAHWQTWTEAECLTVLTSGQVKAGSALDRDAWQRLGQLRGYV